MLPPSDATEALPVRLHLRGPHADAVDRWIGSLGWQAVGLDPAVPVVPALALADVPAVLGDDDVPDAPDDADVVLLVADDDPLLAARAAAHAGVRAVVGWPDERRDLPAVARRLLVRRGHPAADQLRVAGSAGGVGTSTVALALGGLCAWRGPRTLLLRGGGGEPTGPGAGELEGTTAWRGAEHAPGIRALRVLEVADATVRVGEGPSALVVRDLGVATETDVLVVRRDRAGLDAIRATSAGTVVVNDLGIAPHAAVRQAAAGRRLVSVPWSARVARAGLRGRVPAGLPGSWLRNLDPVVARMGRRVDR